MGWWGNKPDAVIICYHCRKRISRDELSAGLHDHEIDAREEPAAPVADASTQ